MPFEGEVRAETRTGLAQSVLREIAEHLSVLAIKGESAVIDLRSLPMTPADRTELEEILGRGDVEAILNVAGTSEIWECRYCGVWWVRHFGTDDKIATERIEITTVPEILITSRDDAGLAAVSLRNDLGSRSFKSGDEHAEPS